jgi:hypothetical protein
MNVQTYTMVMSGVSLVVDGQKIRVPFNYCADPDANMITWVSGDLKSQVFFKNIDWNYEVNQQIQQTLDFFLNSGQVDKNTILSGFWELT